MYERSFLSLLSSFFLFTARAVVDELSFLFSAFRRSQAHSEGTSQPWTQTSAYQILPFTRLMYKSLLEKGAIKGAGGRTPVSGIVSRFAAKSRDEIVLLHLA